MAAGNSQGLGEASSVQKGYCSRPKCESVSQCACSSRFEMCMQLESTKLLSSIISKVASDYPSSCRYHCGRYFHKSRLAYQPLATEGLAFGGCISEARHSERVLRAGGTGGSAKIRARSGVGGGETAALAAAERDGSGGREGRQGQGAKSSGRRYRWLGQAPIPQSNC